jgi:hypothetical protein
MTPQEFAARLQALVTEGREAGLPEEAMAAEMQHAASALRKGPVQARTRQ